MSIVTLLIAGLFFPLFPLSMPFNFLYARLRNPLLRGVILLGWPQVGIAILFATNTTTVPDWLPIWAIVTSLLYAVRALALRELGLWTSYIATSAWALLWILLHGGAAESRMYLAALGFSIPLLLMASLVSGLERRFSAAYIGLYGGLAQSLPRFTGVLVFVVLAVIATPVFPAFFSMLWMSIAMLPAMPMIAIAIGLVWLLWSWAGARLLQGLVTGPERLAVVDLSRTNMWIYIAALAGLMLSGVHWVGAML
jgi:hypothetical protein